MTVVNEPNVLRDLNDSEKAVVLKYRQRYEEAIRQVHAVQESLDDLAAVLAPEEEQVLDVDNMRIVEQPGDGDD